MSGTITPVWVAQVGPVYPIIFASPFLLIHAIIRLFLPPKRNSPEGLMQNLILNTNANFVLYKSAYFNNVIDLTRDVSRITQTILPNNKYYSTIKSFKKFKEYWSDCMIKANGFVSPNKKGKDFNFFERVVYQIKNIEIEYLDKNVCNAVLILQPQEILNDNNFIYPQINKLNAIVRMNFICIKIKNKWWLYDGLPGTLKQHK